MDEEEYDSDDLEEFFNRLVHGRRDRQRRMGPPSSRSSVTASAVAPRIPPASAPPIAPVTAPVVPPIMQLARPEPTILERLGVTNVDHLTQTVIDNGNPDLRRLQKDLLVLTSLPERVSLYWRPSWFMQGDYPKMWGLFNPPNVVSESLPYTNNPMRSNVPYATRRMRQDGDQPPFYIKDWNHWARYCAINSIPKDFLNEDMIKFMRLGLPRAFDGSLVEPPINPRYPEPQNIGQDQYLLHPSKHHNLPTRFHKIADSQVIVVRSNGALDIQPLEDQRNHPSQWTHINGNGEFEDDFWYDGNPEAPLKYQGSGVQWSYLPWTDEQDRSCGRPALTLGVDPFRGVHQTYVPVTPSKTPSKRR